MEFWHGAINQKKLLNYKQKAIRTVTNSKYNSHTEPLFKEISCLKFDNLLDLNFLLLNFTTVTLINYCHLILIVLILLKGQVFIPTTQEIGTFYVLSAQLQNLLIIVLDMLHLNC